ncbi:hypothetical protein BDV97DRAFT_341126 [Delphinella strobiligena]|nr:hypothetical protein BDV97DRAFT_341126 [Delphinella strobiligena]
MQVTIDDLELTYPNGTTASLFKGSISAALLACIVPDFPVMMTLPRFTSSESDDLSYYGYIWKLLRASKRLIHTLTGLTSLQIPTRPPKVSISAWPYPSLQV